MLILLLEPTDKKNEVLIGDDITIKVLDIYPETKQVRIGINAPPDVRVDRAEIHTQRMRRIKKVLDKHIYG